MSNVKYKNTKPEILVRKALFQKGFRYRINDKNLQGHPDIVLKKYKTVVFINGCFWHGHDECPKATLPQTNTVFWKDKILKNKMRDAAIVERLRLLGWKVLIVWECELTKQRFEETLNKLVQDIRNI